MSKRKMIWALVVLALLIGIAGIVLLSRENASLKTEIKGLKQDPQRIAQDETNSIMEKVGKLVMLPTDETPVLATVTDKDKLKDQSLFAKAENGDKILVYSSAQKAYIYNPGKNVIVDVVPVNVGDGSVTITGTDVNNPLKVILLNGSKTVGATASLEQRIKDKKVLGITVSAKEPAKTSDYQKTLVIDLAGKWGSQAAQLAQLLGGQVATQSAETIPSNTDLMVILGADFK